MPESKTIAVPKRMHVVERLAEVQRQIAEWMDSLDEPFDKETDMTRNRHRIATLGFVACLLAAPLVLAQGGQPPTGPPRPAQPGGPPDPVMGPVGQALHALQEGRCS